MCLKICIKREKEGGREGGERKREREREIIPETKLHIKSIQPAFYTFA